MSGETFETLLTPALPAIRKLVRAKIRMPDYTEDVVQQTLMHAFVHREQLRVPSKFKSWISSIAMNEIRGLARRTRMCVPLEALPPIASSDRSTCPYKVFEDGERTDHLYDGLAQLNPRDRYAIHLIDLAEVKLTDAANALSFSRAAMKSAHFRARRRLSRAVRANRRVMA
ncbi:MAG: sigma-70 family RNA polymerase sigma factor [Acidobacteriia bacterium]|nr:sigma-70 family RNA polymerase sigma factor [Terriglobia bacterium]